MSDEQDPMRTYAEAKKRVDALERQLAESGERLGVVASALTRTPVELTLANAGEIEFSSPAGFQTSLDYKRWPSKQDVGRKLMEYYAAQRDLLNAEHRLSAGDRQLLGLRV